MKMETATQLPSVASEDLTEKSFGILANDKMFGILSSKIYTDKILAPIRELSCNAYDANVASGKPSAPIKVHIPSHSEPWFSVEDCGLGMDAHEVEDLYTTYGYSSKTESNKFVGCLGLGSKSPFAYTDRFSIVSRKNGTEYSYQCLIENSMPKLIKFSEIPTSEPSGTKIEFPVKKEDLYSFQEKISSFFTFFSPRPEFIFEGGEVHIHEPAKFNKHGFFFGHTYSNYILMGNVLYEYSLSDFIEQEYADFSRRFCGRGSIIKANIGDVDVTVSRESVEMTKKSKDYIYKRYMEYSKTVEKEFKEETSSGTFMENLKRVYDLSQENFFLDRNLVSQRVEEFTIPLEEDVEMVEEFHNYCSPKRVSRTIKKAFTFTFSELAGEIRFVKEDPEKEITISSSMKEWVNNHNYSRIFAFRSEYFQKKLEENGIPIFKKEDFGPTIRAKREKKKNQSGLEGFYFVEKDYDKPLCAKFVPMTEGTNFCPEDHSTIYYIPIFNRSVEKEEAKSIREATGICDLFSLHSLSPSGTFVVGLNKEALERVKSDPRYKNYGEYLKEKYSKDSKEYKEYCRQETIDWFRRECYPILFIRLAPNSLSEESQKIFDTFLLPEDPTVDKEVVEEFRSFVYGLDKSPFYSALKEFKRKYKMFWFLRDGSYSYEGESAESMKFLQEYIDSVDKQNSTKGE